MNSMDKNTIKSAGCLIFTSSKGVMYVLTIYHDYGANDKGWSFPKGRIKIGESKETAAIREVKEETGVKKIYNIKYLTETSYYFKKKSIKYFKIVTWYFANTHSVKLGKKSLTQDEVLAKIQPQWFPVADAEKKLLFQGEKNVLSQALKLYPITNQNIK